jgi:hypothetical protein
MLSKPVAIQFNTNRYHTKIYLWRWSGSSIGMLEILGVISQSQEQNCRETCFLEGSKVVKLLMLGLYDLIKYQI